MLPTLRSNNDKVRYTICMIQLIFHLKVRKLWKLRRKMYKLGFFFSQIMAETRVGVRV